MRKVLTIIFALYMTIGSSCAVKAEVLSFFNGGAQVEYMKHAEKSGYINVAQQGESFCTKTIQEASENSYTPASVINIPDFPVILFSFVSTLFLSFIFYKRRRKSQRQLSYLNLYSPPLYLKFQRLQFYA